MLTYFVVRKGYKYYKKREGEREYREDVVRRSHAALVPSTTIRKLPPSALHPVASESSEQLYLAVPPEELVDGQEVTALVAYKPPPLLPPPRNNRGALQGGTRDATVATTQTFTPARPPPPPKPAALASAPIVRPKPPPKPAALASAPKPAVPSIQPRKPLNLENHQPTRPQLPNRDRSTNQSSNIASVPKSQTSYPAPPSRAAHRTLLAESESTLKRTNTIGGTGRNRNTPSRKYSFSGVEAAPKPRAFTPPPSRVAKVGGVSSTLGK